MGGSGLGEVVPSDVEARSGWLEADLRAVPVRVRTPAGGARGAVVVVPPVGLEAAVSHRTMHIVAEQAARNGLLAYTFPLAGDGDSQPVAGADLVGTWRSEIRAVVAEAHRSVPDRPLSVVAMRLGAAVVASDPDLGPVDRVVLWEPVSGTRFLSQQRLRRAMDAEVSVPNGHGGVETYGRTFTAGQAADIRGLAMPRGDAGTGAQAIRRGDRSWFERADFTSTISREEITDLVASLPRGTPTEPLPGRDEPSAVLRVDGQPEVVESFVEVGPHRLSGIVSRPTEPQDAAGVILFSAQGPEQRCGPGALWATAARQMARSGVVGLRVDRRRQGDHTDTADLYPPNPYTEEGIRDVVAAIEYARSLAGPKRGPVLGVSSCAGAWLLLRAARRSPVDRVLGLSLTYFGTDLRWLGSPAASVWLGRPSCTPLPGADGVDGVDGVNAVGVGATVTADLGVTGMPMPANPGATLGRTVVRRSRLLARRLGMPPRTAEFEADVREARVTGSLGLTALRPARGRPDVLLGFSPRDVRRFRHLGGDLLRRGVDVHTSHVLDHSLLTEAAREHVLDLVRREAQRL